jgi:anion-transporting  ArsA/GET3 family ATPase
MSAPSQAARPPLKPVVLVTGKGGVGKTTLAVGLAEAARRRDGRAMLIEFGDGESGKRALGRGSKVVHRVVDPRVAMEQAVADLLGSTLLAKVFLGNFAVRPMLRAAPAIRELAMLERVRAYADEMPAGTRVVVDMPSTGHGLTWMRLPVQMRDMFASGPIHDLAVRVIDRISSPERCSVVVVTLPERLVLTETVELCHALDHDVKLPPARLVVNRLPAEMPAAAFEEARAMVTRGGPEGVAARELLRVIEARAEARKDALDILAKATARGAVHGEPVLFGESLDDPKADDVADFLEKEGAA